MSDILHRLQEAFSYVEHLRDERDRAVSLLSQLLERVKSMSIHDDVSALFDECETLVDQLIAKKGDSDAANADLKVKGQALVDKITAALASSGPASTAGAPVPVSGTVTGTATLVP